MNLTLIFFYSDEEDNEEGWTVCTKRKASEKKKIQPSQVSKLTIKLVPQKYTKKKNKAQKSKGLVPWDWLFLEKLKSIRNLGVASSIRRGCWFGRDGSRLS